MSEGPARDQAKEEAVLTWFLVVSILVVFVVWLLGYNWMLVGFVLGLVGWVLWYILGPFDPPSPFASSLDASPARPQPAYRPRRPPIPKAVKQAVFARDGGRCVYCGSNHKIHFDHIIPFSKGGADTEENLQILCQTCNLRKGANL